MIPPGFDPDQTSPGEQIVFERLRTDPQTLGWIVLHSLDVPDHRRQVAGEVDFVIIIPAMGVLCLEVKSHRTVARDASGTWHLGNDLGSYRGPFKQASEGMHSLRQRLKAMDSSLASVPFTSAVCFTHARFDLESPVEWSRWQVIDQHDLATSPIGLLAKRALDGARAKLAGARTARWFNPAAVEPTASQCERILLRLRPNFEFFESPRSRREARDSELRHYTEQQFGALQALEGNKRLLFEGQAGTGKTLLAIEAARRLSNAGQRVALVCFNRLLAGWLRKQFDRDDSIWVGSLHSLLLEVASTAVPESAGPDFWARELPDIALANALSDGVLPRFDALVIDEAQDILRDQYLDVLDALLDRGIRAGSWRMFGDFLNQAIYGAPVSPLAVLATRCPSDIASYVLTENCRNPPRIAEQLSLLSGAPRYRRVLRPDNGLDGELRLYADDDEQQSQLNESLGSLKGAGYRPNEIVVLSRFAAGVVKRVPARGWTARVCPLDAETPACLRAGTVHSFKGLEAPVVIVTDIDRIGDAEADAILYVGMSRATERLVVLASTATRDAVTKRLIKGTHG